MILTCIVAGFVARLSSERIIQASELPTNTLLPESKIRELQEAVKNGSVSVFYVLDCILSEKLLFLASHCLQSGSHFAYQQIIFMLRKRIYA